MSEKQSFILNPPLKTTKKRPVWGVFDMAWHGGFAKNRVGL
jgi:hypothetical protein